MVETGIGLNQQLSLARVGDTRWRSHFRVLLRLKKMFTLIIDVLEELKYDRSASEAKGVTNELSQALKRSDQDILKDMQLVEVSKKMFKPMRDDGCEEFFERVLLSCGKLVINVPDMESRCYIERVNERFSPERTELLQCVACLSPCSSFEAFDTKSIVRMARLFPNDFNEVGDEELSTQPNVYIHCVRDDVNFSNLKGLS